VYMLWIVLFKTHVMTVQVIRLLVVSLANLFALQLLTTWEHLHLE